MVTIESKDGKEVFNVTKGAYDSVFKKQGYAIVQPASAAGVVDNEALPKPSGDDLFVAELLEKPIAQWSKEEVKKFAAIKGINVAGAKTVSEVKELIKASLA